MILLPLYVFYYAYCLLFLRQFGPEYDVWANAAALPETTDFGGPPEAQPVVLPFRNRATSEPPPPTEPPPLPT